MLLILIGSSGGRYDLSAPSTGDPRTIAGNRYANYTVVQILSNADSTTRLSFFSLCLSAAITYSTGSADYFVYYPEHISSIGMFSASVAGLTLSFTLVLIVGAGLASGLALDPEWSAASAVSPGALIASGFNRLGRFGDFCAVILALGLISNMVAPTYSSGIDFQILGRYAARIPRIIWNTFGIIVFTACALAGRNSLSVIFTNFLALMGYWVAIWIAITLEEQLLFRKTAGRWGVGLKGYDWTAWADKSRLPIGIAAMIAFLVGWAGAILCMAQLYYIGPIARLVGTHGADVSSWSLSLGKGLLAVRVANRFDCAQMGNYVGFVWAGLVYPPLRYLELKKFGR